MAPRSQCLKIGLSGLRFIRDPNLYIGEQSVSGKVEA